MDEAKNQKDHREIGQELDLFSFHEIAPGAVFWHPKGWTIYRTLQDFIRKSLAKEGYSEISTPIMVKSDLFKQSGHWDFYNENMFNPDVDSEIYSLKPMNCPEACLIFKTKTRSYQDLPIRYSDFGILHRNELSGVLGGLFRVRQFSIDDAHNFIKPDQIQSEIKNLLDLVSEIYNSLGFKLEFFLSTKPDKAMGDPELWKEAERDLKEALDKSGVKYRIKEKDGAFYGPKIDIQMKDSQDRDWQLATIQLDFQTPEKMNLEYIDADGKPKRPVIIHRALLGSLERFIGILLEHYQGALPIWLSPIQVEVISVSDKVKDYADKVYNKLRDAGIRVVLNEDNQTLQAKIRHSTLQKTPYMCIIGMKEAEMVPDFVSVRTRTSDDLGTIELGNFIERIKEEIEKRK